MKIANMLFLLPLILLANEKIAIKGGDYIVPPTNNFYIKYSKSRKFNLKDFFIDKYEVSYKEIGKKSIQSDELNYPVVRITYNDAKNYCLKNGGDLPTPEQWLIAASFENNKFYSYSTKQYPIVDIKNINIKEDRAIELEITGFGAETDIVDVKDALIGNNHIVGMLGNVWELTKSNNQYTILKGGSFYNIESLELLDNRIENKVLKSNLLNYEHIGFRCVYNR